MDKSIIPECFADTLLIETLVPTKRGYNHQRSCFKVESTMKGLNSFDVGIIDKDKKQIRYLDKFKIIDEVAGDLICGDILRNKFIIGLFKFVRHWKGCY